MEEYLKERKSRFNGLKIKGRIIENQGLKTHNPGKSDKPDHTRDYGRKSQKVNERIARKYTWTAGIQLSEERHSD